MNTPIGILFTKTRLKGLAALLVLLGIGLATPSALYAQTQAGLTLQLDPPVACILQTVNVGVANLSYADADQPLDTNSCFQYGDGLHAYLDVSACAATNDAFGDDTDSTNFMGTVMLTANVDESLNNVDNGWAWGTFTPPFAGYYAFTETEDIGDCYGFNVSTQAWLLVGELDEFWLYQYPNYYTESQFQQLDDNDYAGFFRGPDSAAGATLWASTIPADTNLAPIIQWTNNAYAISYDEFSSEFGVAVGGFSATNPGEYTPEVTMCNQILGPFNFWFISVALTNITFGGNGYQQLYQDNGSQYADQDQWTPNSSVPLSYIAGYPMILWPTFVVTPSSYSGPLLFEGNSSGPELPNFSSLTPTLESDNFYYSVQYYDPLTIDWKCSMNDGGNWQDICTSSNTNYVTLSASRAPTLYETVAFLACFQAGASDAKTAARNTWTLFSSNSQGPANVSTWDNWPLYYYQPGYPFEDASVDIAGLLATGNGQCGAWQQLLAYAWGANGIQSVHYQVEGPTIDGNLYPFLVKNWGFGQPSHPNWAYPYVLDAVADPNDPAWVTTYKQPVGGWGDLSNQAKLSGQNSITPAEKAFCYHQIQWYNGLFYDPSYGVTYTDNADFQSKAIDGFADGFQIVNGQAQVFVQQPNNNNVQIQFFQIQGNGF